MNFLKDLFISVLVLAIIVSIGSQILTGLGITNPGELSFLGVNVGSLLGVIITAGVGVGILALVLNILKQT